MNSSCWPFSSRTAENPIADIVLIIDPTKLASWGLQGIQVHPARTHEACGKVAVLRSGSKLNARSGSSRDLPLVV